MNNKYHLYHIQNNIVFAEITFYESKWEIIWYEWKSIYIKDFVKKVFKQKNKNKMISMTKVFEDMKIVITDFQEDKIVKDNYKIYNFKDLLINKNNGW